MGQEIKKTCWFELDGKQILLISEKWNGKPMIACMADVVLIPEVTYERFKDSGFVGEGKNNKIIFI